MKKIAPSIGSTVLLLLLSVTTFASQEATRHITGEDIDLYFMNDKLFGHIDIIRKRGAAYLCHVNIYN